MSAVHAERIDRMEFASTILVVNTDPQVLRVLHEILSRAGYRVLQARDSAEAIRMYEQHRHALDLMVADDLTPELERFLAVRPGLPVLGLSDDGASPMFPSVLKPFTPGVLLDAVRRTLRRAS